MKAEEMIKQLEDLREHCRSMIDESDLDNIWTADVEALDKAIEKLKGECVGTDPSEIVRRILEIEGMNQKELADKMGVVRQNVSQQLSRNKMRMRFDGFSKMVSALGYEIVLRKI